MKSFPGHFLQRSMWRYFLSSLIQNFTIQVHQTISIFSYHRKWKLELNFCISWTRMCKCFFYFRSSPISKLDQFSQSLAMYHKEGKLLVYLGLKMSCMSWKLKNVLIHLERGFSFLLHLPAEEYAQVLLSKCIREI